MKGLVKASFIFILMVFSSAVGLTDNRYHSVSLFSSEAFESSTAEYSAVINMDAIRKNKKPDGYFSVQVYLNDADGSMTLEWLGSNDGTNYTEPYDSDGNAWDDICTSFAYDGGPGGDGRAIFTVQPPPTKYLKVKGTPSAHAITGLTVELVYF